MTLRGSEQSLLHNPSRKGVRKNTGPANTGHRNSSLTRSLRVFSAIFTLTMLAALNLSQLQENDFTTSSFGEAGLKDVDFAYDIDKSHDHTAVEEQTVHMRGDVIIYPENSPHQNLRQLTNTNLRDTPAPFQVSTDKVMEMLTAAGEGTISIDPDLKFYETTNIGHVSACPKNVKPYDFFGNISPACFLIKAAPTMRGTPTRAKIL